jgi:hypothetical protein
MVTTPLNNGDLREKKQKKSHSSKSSDIVAFVSQKFFVTKTCPPKKNAAHND